LTDIDIDFFDRSLILKLIDHIPASRNTEDGFKAHNTGVYFQKIPHNPLTGLASIDYKEAETRGYFKVDFLNVSAYQGVKNEAHLLKLMEQEPIWPLLWEEEISSKLLHVNNYHSLLAECKPASIIELAMFLAIIRPGKKHLIKSVIEKGWNSILNEIWTKTDDGYTFRKSHAIAYSQMIVVQLNLLCEN
jgi:hypothetical protein